MSCVLVVDLESEHCHELAHHLQAADYTVLFAGSAEAALELLASERVAVIVSRLPQTEAFELEFIDVVHRRRPGLPVVLVADASAAIGPHLVGAVDGLLREPLEDGEVARAVARALDRASSDARDLRERGLSPTLFTVLASSIEARSPGGHGHCERLAALAGLIAGALELPEEAVRTVRLGAMLHDVGLIGIPDRIVLESGMLEPSESALMRTHPLIGDQLLAPLDELGDVRAVVRGHHERWDGHGYPDGLSAEAIPLGARIVAVADGIEAMSVYRPYRPPLTPRQILRELAHGRGTQWDPSLVGIAIAIISSGAFLLGRGTVSPRAQSDPRSVTRSTVLVVEGDPARADAAHEALERALGTIEVSQATEVDAAARLAFGAEWSLAVVDGALPDGGTLELLAALRAASPHVPIVVLVDEGAGSATDALEHGASDFVLRRDGYLDELASRVSVLLGVPELAASTG